MTEPIPHFEASCPNCSWSEMCGPEGIARRLIAARKLKPVSELNLAMLAELFLALAARLPCPECGHVGLLVKRRSDLDGDWPCARSCVDVGRSSAGAAGALPRGHPLRCLPRKNRSRRAGRPERILPALRLADAASPRPLRRRDSLRDDLQQRTPLPASQAGVTPPSRALNGALRRG